MRLLTLASLITFISGVHAHAGPARGPWIADLTSTSARVCWRAADAAQLCKDITGLSPGTTFSYMVPVTTMSYIARALPGPGRPIRFAVFGDAGKATRAQYNVAALVGRLEPDFVIYTGDLVYPRGEDADYDPDWFGVYGWLLATRPFFPVLGNHDYGNFRAASRGQAIYERNYRVIHGRGKYYYFSAGDARFFMLDDNAAYRIEAAASLAEDGDQLTWLKREAAARRPQPWSFAVLHVPLYASRKGHGDNDLLRRRLEPIFRSGRFQAVFAGHDHLYQRSKPMYGITHFTVGTGGGGLNFGGTPADWLAHEEERYGLLFVTLDAKGLNAKFFGVDGKVYDELSIARP